MRATILALAGLLSLGGGVAFADDDDRLRKTDPRWGTRDDDRLHKDDDWDEDDCEDWDDRECWRTEERSRGRSRDAGVHDARRFRGLDTNRDGRITRAEWRGNDRSFRNHDRNGDGVITSSEMSRQRQVRRASRDRRYDDYDYGGYEEYHVWDRDRDGRLERGEWRDKEKDFSKLDRNRDGWLSRSELRRD